ncbi:hypothetical protein ABXV19_16065 [Pseudomonas alkylphenolica]|uniref:hypothetical protein n=1 Tax=Pseudomonas alkylphenolica TaxID=237609 RepID=UPI0033962613
MVISKKSLLCIQLPMFVVGAVVGIILLIDILLPFTSAYADVVPGYFVYLAFFTLIYVVYSLLVLGVEVALPVVQQEIRSPNCYLTKCMTLACLVSMAGILALVIDRTMYQGVDFFSQSFVEIRSRLNAEREPGSDVSSWFSVFGNLFQFSYFFTFSCLVFYYEGFSRARRKFYILLVIFCLLSGSYILGGRSIFGLFALTMIAMLVARSVSGRSSLRQLLSGRITLAIFVLLLLVVAAVVYVFYARASISGMDSSTYLHNFVEHLHGRPVIGYQACTGSMWCDALNYLQLSGIYVTHVFWVLAETIAHPVMKPEGVPVFGASAVILAKVFGSLSGEYEFAGLFNSMPGSLFYQYGGLGVTAGAFFLGFAVALSVCGLRRGGGIVSIVVFYALFMALLVAPVLSILNMMVFIFVLFSMFVMSIIYLLRISMARRSSL